MRKEIGLQLAVIGLAVTENFESQLKDFLYVVLYNIYNVY